MLAPSPISSGIITSKSQLLAGLNIAYKDEENIFTEINRFNGSFVEINTLLFVNSPMDVFSNTASLIRVFRDNNTAGAGAEINFDAYDDASNQTTYGRIRMEIRDSTDGSEDGKFEIYVRNDGTIEEVVTIWDDGAFDCGSVNQRLRLKDTGLTAQIAPVWSNLSGILGMVGAKSGTTTTISNTTSETDLLNYSVSSNQIGSNGVVRFKISGYLLQNQATSTTYTFKIKFGGTVMWEDATSSISQSATKLPFIIEGELYNKNATNAQGCSGRIMINDTSAAGVGIGAASDDEILVNANFDSEGSDTSKDTTTANTLTVTVTMSVADANTQTVVKNYIVEVIT